MHVVLADVAVLNYYLLKYDLNLIFVVGGNLWDPTNLYVNDTSSNYMSILVHAVSFFMKMVKSPKCHRVLHLFYSDRLLAFPKCYSDSFMAHIKDKKVVQ